MKGLDTNILVRFLVGDDENQAEKVYKIFKKTEAEKKELFVPVLVVLELIWVLESAYGISRSEILDSIDSLLLMPIFKFENIKTLQNFILSASENKLDLSDLLIAHSASAHNCETVLTFDKQASKFKIFELVK